MKEQQVKLGIIGCGVIGKQHIAAAQQNGRVALIGIADAVIEAAHAAAAQYGVANVYGDADLLLADPAVEAIVLAVPTHIRTGLALRALAAGKHVLLEKPLALHAEELERLQEAAQREAAAGRSLTVAFCSSRFRFLEHAQAAATWIAAGHLGELRVIRCRVNEPATGRPAAPQPAWRVHRAINGGGIVANWGSYDFDYLLGLTGWQLQPTWVLARMWGPAIEIADYFPPDSDTETYGTAYIQGADGVTLTYERGEFMGAPRERTWQIIGSRASLTLHMTWPADKRIVACRLDPETGVEEELVWEGTEDSSWIDKGAVFDFVEAIADGRPPATGLSEALQLQRLMDALYESADTGEPVRMSQGMTKGGEMR